MIFFWAAEVYGEGIAGCRRGRLEMWASGGGKGGVRLKEWWGGDGGADVRGGRRLSLGGGGCFGGAGVEGAIAGDAM